MNKDELKGKAKNLKGKIKDAVGAITGDKDLQAEGERDRIGGAAQEKFGEVKRKTGDAIEELGEDIKH